MVTVATAADERYVAGALIALRSALDRARAPLDLVLVDGGIAPDTAARVRTALLAHPRAAAFELVRLPEERLTGLPGLERFSPSTWTKALLGELLPGRSRAVFLDADVLVRRELDALWATDLAGRTFGAVRDAEFPTAGAGLEPAVLAGEALDPAGLYVNAGVLLADLDRQRACDVAGRALAWTRRWADAVRWGDQDALNAVSAGDVLEVDPRWNVQADPVHRRVRGRTVVDDGLTAARLRELEADAWVVHFVGLKPWQGEGLRASRSSLRWHAEAARALHRSGGLPRRQEAALAGRWARELGARVGRRLPGR